jgi:hypothetical protein
MEEDKIETARKPETPAESRLLLAGDTKSVVRR